MATPMYDTLNSQIAGETKGDLTYRNLHTNLQIVSLDGLTKLNVPLKDILSKYRYMLEKYIKYVNLNDIQYEHYRQNPQLLSNDVYGTTQFWAIILELNHCPSRYEFNIRNVKIYDPLYITQLINDILIAEEELK